MEHNQRVIIKVPRGCRLLQEITSLDYARSLEGKQFIFFKSKCDEKEPSYYVIGRIGLVVMQDGYFRLYPSIPINRGDGSGEIQYFVLISDQEELKWEAYGIDKGFHEPMGSAYLYIDSRFSA